MVRYGDGDFFGGRRVGGKSFTLVISAEAGLKSMVISHCGCAQCEALLRCQRPARRRVN